MNLKDLEKKLFFLNYLIEDILKTTNFEKSWCVRPEGLNLDNPEDNFLAEEFDEIFSELSILNARLNYLARPIEATAFLFKGSSGRYTAKVISSQSESPLQPWEYGLHDQIEFLYKDPFNHNTGWRIANISFSDAKDDFFISGYPDIELDGLTVRRRAIPSEH